MAKSYECLSSVSQVSHNPYFLYGFMNFLNLIIRITHSHFTWHPAHKFLPFCDSKTKQKTILSISGGKEICIPRHSYEKCNTLYFGVIGPCERLSIMQCLVGSLPAASWNLWMGAGSLDFSQQVHLLAPEHLLQGLCCFALVSPAESPHNRDKWCLATNRTETLCVICGLWTQ